MSLVTDHLLATILTASRFLCRRPARLPSNPVISSPVFFLVAFRQYSQIPTSPLCLPCHDPQDPLSFNPERFLGPSPEVDSHDLAFGFGRRICPEKELAGASTFMSIAMTLSAFRITKAGDRSGREIEPVCDYCVGIIRHRGLGIYIRVCGGGAYDDFDFWLAILRSSCAPSSLGSRRLV